MANRTLKDSMPLAPLKIIAMDNCRAIGEKVNERIINRRKKALAKSDKPGFMTADYTSDNYLIQFETPRRGTGEGRAVLGESIRGCDLFIISDVVNYHQTYTMRGFQTNASPDDHFSDLKRIIMACGGHPRRITVIMPYLYEGRQHLRISRESLDCAQALQELVLMGVETIITFDAHDDRVQNAIPIHGFDNFYTSFQFIDEILKTNPKLKTDSEHLTIVSPDEGGMRRAVYYANQMGVDMGMCYKRKDYSKTVNGTHPVVSFEYLGKPVDGKSVIIVDDMIASGKTILETAKEMKKRNAAKILLCATFGLFSDGIENLDKAYEDHLFDSIYTTNLCYCPEEIKQRPYYHNVDLSNYIALIINTLNHDISVNEIQNANKRIQKLIQKHNARE